ncbi:MAG TPA: transposase zinc-binding domain-containing protein [Polyangiaceae bacterium]
MSEQAGSTAAAVARAPITYERHRPETTTLYAVVRDNINTLYGAVQAGFTGAALPEFVRAELEGYLSCGLLCRGFALLKCSDWAERRLVAFSCKGRGFCPSCFGRRMCQTAANLVDHVVPKGVPLRQWVLTLPHALRYRLAYDGKLLGAVCRIFVDSVLGWYRRRLSQDGAAGGKSGAVTVIQRTASDLRLHPHFHGVFLDGVYVQSASGELEFVALAPLRTTEVADVLQVVRARTVNYLERRGVVEGNAELRVLDDELSEREPAVAHLARAECRASNRPVRSCGAERSRSGCAAGLESRSLGPCVPRNSASTCMRPRELADSTMRTRSAAEVCIAPSHRNRACTARSGWVGEDRPEAAVQGRHRRHRSGSVVSALSALRLGAFSEAAYGQVRWCLGRAFQVALADHPRAVRRCGCDARHRRPVRARSPRPAPSPSPRIAQPSCGPSP